MWSYFSFKSKLLNSCYNCVDLIHWFQMLFFIDQRKIKYVHVCVTGDVKEKKSRLLKFSHLLFFYSIVHICRHFMNGVRFLIAVCDSVACKHRYVLLIVVLEESLYHVCTEFYRAKFINCCSPCFSFLSIYIFLLNSSWHGNFKPHSSTSMPN